MDRPRDDAGVWCLEPLHDARQALGPACCSCNLTNTCTGGWVANVGIRLAAGWLRPLRSAPSAPLPQTSLRAEAAPAAPVRFLAAGLAAAAVATCSPAEAGVVLVQPEVKNFVKGTTPAAKTPEEKKAAAPKAKAQEEASAPGSGFEAFRPLVLPLSLLFVGGAGAAAVKADPKFGTLLDEKWGSRDSNDMGVGYETAPGLKDTPFYGVSSTNGAKAAAPAKVWGGRRAVAGQPGRGGAAGPTGRMD